MKKLVSTTGLSREEWLRYRKMGIGGSDAGAICGLNPYSSAMQVFSDKTAAVSEDEDKEAMRQGRELEQYVTVAEGVLKEIDGVVETSTSISETKPDAIVFAFDVHAPTFRHEFYKEYKAGRHATPQELIDQFPVMKELLGYLGYPVIAIEGWEADDILGTISRICEEKGAECVISTGDRDSLQLVSEKTTVFLAATIHQKQSL